MTTGNSVRLDRLLGNMGYGSRKDLQRLAKAGAISLDGQSIRDPGTKLAVHSDLERRLTIDDVPIDPLPGFVLMMHKPVGVTCSHKEAGPLVYDLLPDRWRRRKPAVSTVGRLDKDTSGLLLLTDDGAFLHRVTSPRHHVAKHYRVTLAHPLRGDAAATFASGTLRLHGDTQPLRPARLEANSASPCCTHSYQTDNLMDNHATNPLVVTVTIWEGRYHQVRRMFAALGNHVVALQRLRVGGLELPDDLEPGAYRRLDAAARDRVLISPDTQTVGRS